MVDFVFFFTCAIGIIVLLWLRYLYAKSLTGLTAGDKVDPSYWGAYANVQPGGAAIIQLPKTRGMCPACQRRSMTVQCAHPFQ